MIIGPGMKSRFRSERHGQAAIPSPTDSACRSPLGSARSNAPAARQSRNRHWLIRQASLRRTSIPGWSPAQSALGFIRSSGFFPASRGRLSSSARQSDIALGQRPSDDTSGKQASDGISDGPTSDCLLGQSHPQRPPWTAKRSDSPLDGHLTQHNRRLSSDPTAPSDFLSTDILGV